MADPESFTDMIDALHEDARKSTGLDDFGDPSYREGLEVLLASLDEDDNLSPLGRAIYRGTDRQDPRLRGCAWRSACG